MKKIIISIFGLSLIGLTNASEKNGELKSSATIQATCLISANQIGFGAIATPLLAQTTQSEMNVKCSNASAYTIDLAYGGVYGQGKNYSIRFLNSYEGSAEQFNYYIITGDTLIGSSIILCGYGSRKGTVLFSEGTGQIYGYANTSGWIQDKKNACISNGTVSGTKPSNWNGSYNASGIQYFSQSGYDYGIMNGSAKGDKLAYSIQIPEDNTKVWNVGNNSYKATGNGDNQIIPLVAKIVPDKSGSKYPAPDMYLDTVTAVISY